jgi:hypothetical protein
MTTPLILACRKKSRLLKKFTKNRTPENRIILQRFRNQLKSSLRKAERQHYLAEFNKRSSTLKSTWALINQLLHHNQNSSTNTSSPTSLIWGNKQYSSPIDIVNQFNDYFSSIGKELSNNISHSFKSFHDYLTSPNPHTFTLYPTDSTEIFNLLSELDSTSSQAFR